MLRPGRFRQRAHTICLVRQWSSRNLPARAAFRAETGLVGSRGVHHQCLSRSGLSSLAAASGLSFPASGYGQCCIRICLYLNPPPALKSQNWRYRLGRSRCMQNAFVALARYRDNMERPHRFQSEFAKGYRQDNRSNLKLAAPLQIDVSMRRLRCPLCRPA